MALETVTYPADLVVTNPTTLDGLSQGDDHLRNIKTAFKNAFPGFTGGILLAGTTTGSANAYVLTPTQSLPSYKDGMGVFFKTNFANTGACTLNVSGLGSKPIRARDGAALTSGDLPSGLYFFAIYDETNGYWVLPRATLGDHSVRAVTGNGYGSTNTKIRRFTTFTTTGTNITSADTSGNGSSFTINATGIYAIQYSDTHSGAATYRIGISVNSAELTTDIQSLTSPATRVAVTSGPATSGLEAQCFAVVRLTTNDVVRAHNGATLPTGVSSESDFWIRRLG